MNPNFWRIEGFDGVERIYSRDVLAGQITLPALDLLLRALVAKRGLTEDETVDCFLRASCNGYRDLLAVRVHNDPISPARSCGSNPHFLATLTRSVKP